MIPEDSNLKFLVLLIFLIGCGSDQEKPAVVSPPPPVIDDIDVQKSCGFERNPFLAHIELINNETKEGELAIIGLHSKPESVFEELEQMLNVNTDSMTDFGVTDSILLGDFNADCGYLSTTEYNSLKLVTNGGYAWLIDNDADTNVSTSTSCTYDRILEFGDTFTYANSEVITNQIDDTISDHFLVKTELSVPDGNTYKIASFNIQRYGPTKAGNAAFTEAMKDILDDYDIVLLMEITSVDQTVINHIIPTGYEYVMSERLGTTSYKEQYVYVYNPDKIVIVESKVFSCD